MARKLAAWKQEYLDSLAKMSNEKLFAEAFYRAQPDDYDGCHTYEGEYYAGASADVLKERLADWLGAAPGCTVRLYVPCR